MTPTNPTPATAVDTNGWDVVYAIRYADVNAAIAKKSSSPPTFSQTSSDDDGQQTATGTFGDWQLTTGGDGKNLWMTLPIPTASFTFLGATDTLTGLSAVAEINLDWLGTGHQQTLTTGTGSVSIQRIDVGSNTLSAARQALFRSLLETWLIGHVGTFQHTFALLNLADVADTGKFAWLKPKGKPSYAIADADDSTDISQSVFAVLAMTSTAPVPGVHEVSPLAIPAGVNSALLLRPQLVVEHLFKPGIHLLFDKATTDQFDLSNGGLSITNNTAVSFGKQQVSDDKDVTPTLDIGNFTFTLFSNKVLLAFTDMTFEWSPGITVSVNHKTQATIGLTTGNHLSMSIIGSHTDSSVETSTGVLVGEILGSIAGAILGAVVGGLAAPAVEGGVPAIAEGGQQAAIDGIEMVAQGAADAAINTDDEAASESADELTALIANQRAQAGAMKTFFARAWVKLLAGAIGSAILGAVSSTVVETLKAIAGEEGKTLPTLDTFGQEALGSLTWPDTTPNGFTLKSLDLAGALRFGVQVS
jgi:hypothetical protein